jgi:CheY-like chemotaxis protein
LYTPYDKYFHIIGSFLSGAFGLTKGEPPMAREILIAGSDITDQGEFEKIFESTDYHVVFSDKAEEALLRIKLFKPDLIIAGTALSGKGGIEFCEIVKLDPEFRDIPVILVSGILEEITEQDRIRAKADGVISKPLSEGEVLNLVDGFMEGGALKLDEEVTGAGKEWKFPESVGKTTNNGKGGLFLDDMGDLTEEEIIELVDVVEEAEPIMSIDDFITAKQEGLYAEISNKEASEKTPAEEEKPYGELDFLTFDEKEIETKDEAVGAMVGKAVEKKAKPAPPTKDTPSEDEIFEKIDLEEILAKVERIQPSIEKEWPREKAIEEKTAPKPALPSQKGDATEELFNIDYFESALKLGVKDETPAPELQPFSLEEPGKEAPGEISLEELPLEEEAAKETDMKLFSFEEPGKEGVEEISIEEELPAEEEELKELLEEEFPEDIFEEMLEEEEIHTVEELKEEELKEEEIKAVEELEAVQVEEEEIQALEEFKVEELKEEETVIEKAKPAAFDFFEEKPEPAPQEIEPEPEAPEERELFAAMEASGNAPETTEETVSPMIRAVEKQLEEVIAKGVQDMIGDFITKILPEMTQNIMNLTADRIEKMVREVVPELAEKAIQEEIKKIQKEVKD